MNSVRFLQTLVMSLFLGISMSAQTFIDEFEDFNAGLPGDWSTIVNSGSCDWSSSADMPVGPDFGSPGMVFNDFECGDGAAASNATLYSEVYYLEYPFLTLTFGFEVTFQEVGSGETFTLEAFTDEGWEEVMVYDSSLSEIPYESFTGEANVHDFQIRWTYDDADGAWGMHGAIDNFFIKQYGLGVEDSQIPGFTMFPNPAVDLVTINASIQIQKVIFFNSLGQKVLVVTPNALSQEINVATLKAGVYVVNVVSHEQQGTYRLIKQ